MVVLIIMITIIMKITKQKTVIASEFFNVHPSVAVQDISVYLLIKTLLGNKRSYRGVFLSLHYEATHSLKR